MIFDKFDEYYQRLLIAQFDISEMIEHSLTKGEIREDFLKSIITEQFPSLQITSGIISDGTNQSPQTDIIITKSDCRYRKLGSKNIVDNTDCKLVLEVKSNCKGKDIKKFNDDAGIIKSLGNNNILCGMFCYKIDLIKNTILERFGYKFNNTYMTYEDYDSQIIKYPNIDFLISIDNFGGVEDEEIFIIFDKDKVINQQGNRGGYSFFIDKPSIKNLFNILNGIK